MRRYDVQTKRFAQTASGSWQLVQIDSTSLNGGDLADFYRRFAPPVGAPMKIEIEVTEAEGPKSLGQILFESEIRHQSAWNATSVDMKRRYEDRAQTVANEAVRRWKVAELGEHFDRSDRAIRDLLRRT